LTPRFLPGNALRLLESGAQYFPELIRAIDDAREQVHLESYIFAADATGTRIAEALKRAAGRGVAVHLLLDGFGSRTLSEKTLEDMRGAGVDVLFFRPDRQLLRLRRHRLRRLHRKLAVVDGRIAFVGGINIIDDMDTPGHTPPRYDYAVRVEGPLLTQICEAAQRLWELVLWTHVAHRPQRRQPVAAVADRAGSVHAAFLVRDNLRHRREIERAYLRAIGRARQEVVIANAYFLPGFRFRRALVEAARRGVRVILLLQGRVEYRLLHYASRALYGRLLKSGVEIVEYHRSFMHAKVAVIDGRWATVGSSNIDPFSLLMAREANVVVADRDFARQLRDSLAQAMAHGSHPVHRHVWLRQPRHMRLLSWVSYALVRFLMGMVGYGREERRGNLRQV
jgi:cardiolipin synthase A/B